MTISTAKASRSGIQSSRKRSDKGKRTAWLRLTRLASQVAFALLFVYLFLSTTFGLASPLPVDLFLRLDPLVGIGASLATRAPTTTILWAMPVVVGTVLLGRIFCGWICPLGATLDAVRIRPRGEASWSGDQRWKQAKYLVLAFVLTSAALGSVAALAFDPISLLTRSASVLVFPGLDQLFEAVTGLLIDVGVPLSTVAGWKSKVRGGVLPFEPGHYALAPLFLLVLASVVGLNAVAHRFWCRYLCPLGALLALLGRRSLLKRNVDGCVACKRCVDGCRMGGIVGEGRQTAVGECVLCGECQSVCPRSAVRYGSESHAYRYDPSRRRVLLAAGAGAAGVLTMSMSPSTAFAHPHLIRPPGAQKADFLSLCVRCGQCMKVCPSGGLQPSLLEAGISGIWSPILVPRVGPCEYPCYVCGQVCPTGAISRLTPEEKVSTVIGTAYIDRSRCIPWADGLTCGVCEEVCQVPTKAIKFEEVEVADESGARRVLKRPVVLREDCIGCGVCEHNCPLPGPSAIRVLVQV